MTNIAAAEMFLVFFAKAMLAVDDDGSAPAEAAIAAAEVSLEREYPDAPQTFTELVIEAAPVMQKLFEDSKEIAAYYDRLADELTSSSN